MRRRIEQLLEGSFDYGVKPLKFSQERIVSETDADSILSGSFSAASEDGRRVKGFLYSSNPRVTFAPKEFYSTTVKINYQVSTDGLKEGDEVSGYFTVCSDKGERSLPYLFEVKGKSEEEENPEIITTPQLCEMAKEDFGSAAALFAGKAFRRQMEADKSQAGLIYNALAQNALDAHALEEFLIGCGLKEPVSVAAATESIRLTRPERPVSEKVQLHRSGWGYLEMAVHSDAPFLRIDKKKLATTEFVGDVYDLEYIVDTNFLHAGKNYGRITVSSCYGTLFIDVEIVQEKELVTQSHESHVRRLMQKKLLALYIDLRLKRVEISAWVERSMNVISSYKRAGGDDIFADLFLLQLYFAGGKKMKGAHLLEELEHEPARFRTHDQYAFYLYMSTFYQREAEYVDQVEARIEQMFLMERESWIMQWILLYLQERYLRDENAKLEVISQSIENGCSSPIMYLEAALILRKNPYQLRRLGKWEIKVLSFAVREKMLTEELSYQICNLASHMTTFDSQLLRILEGCYQLTGARDVVQAVCQILIAGDRKDKECFVWYARGVAADLRLTGLYEYYMETMETDSIEKMPQIIRMYFSYNSSLNYHKKAAIYRNISDNRESVPQLYRDSRRAIENFVTEQLSLGRIDQNLAVLYERFLTRKLLGKALAEKLVKLLFTFEVTCKNPEMKSVIVVHPDLCSQEEVLLTDGRAKVQIYTADARILLSDGNGKRYMSPSLYMAERYLDSPLLIRYCQEVVPEHPGLVLYVTSQREPITAETKNYYRQACSSEMFTEEKQIRFRKSLLRYYEENPKEDGLYAWLKSLPLGIFAHADKRSLVTLLTQEGMYEKAFEVISRQGAEDIPINTLVRICSQSVLEREYEENSLLLAFCFDCFKAGKYDDNILGYLLMYYDGPVEAMKHLWVTAAGNDLDTITLEEKILSLVLFTRTGSAGTEQIFDSYRRGQGRKKICTAYVILKAYEYLVLNEPVADLIFGYIEETVMKKHEAEAEDVCVLALLRFYTTLPQLDEKQTQFVSESLAAYNAKGIRLAFFQKFPHDLTRPISLDDKAFIEYVANPAHEVILSWRRAGKEEEYRKEPMKNCFEGIFVREFVLFDTEKIEYKIEEYDGETQVGESATGVAAGHPGRVDTSRFALIGKMNRLEEAGDAAGLEEELNNYLQLKLLTGELFTLI